MLQNKTLCICQYITHAAFWCSAAVHPLPSFGFVKEISLVCSLCTSGEGSIKEGGGLRGWVADWRQAVISLPAWHLPTAANPPLISSRPCAWQQRGFEISPSPRVKNHKPYHFVTSTFRATEAGVPLMCWSGEHRLPRCFKYIVLLALLLLLFLFI